MKTKYGAFVLVAIGLVFAMPAKAATADHIVISQVQTDGVDGSGGTSQDFIELYNPSSEPIDISGWKLRKKTTSGSESSVRVFPSGSTIPGYGFFLWARSSEAGFAESLGADATSTASLSNNNSIALKDDSDNLVDQLAWGEGHAGPFIEGSAAENPAGAESLERLPGSGQGNGDDTDENSADFFLQSTPHPRNSSSPIEAPGGDGEAEEEQAAEQTPTPSGGGFAIELSEIMPNPAGSDSGNEWVELYNSGSGQANLSGWILDDAGDLDIPGSSAYELEEGTIIEQGGYLAIYIPKGRFALNNADGDFVRLFDNGGNLRLGQQYPGPAKSGFSYARNSSGQWEWTETPTPDEPNSFPEPVQQIRTIRISEVLPNPDGDDLEGEFIELYNYGSDGVDLSGWVVADPRKRFTISEEDYFDTEILPQDYFVVYREVSGIALNNSGSEEVFLYDPSGEVVSRIEFDARGHGGESYSWSGTEVYQWTEAITPGEQNRISFAQQEDEGDGDGDEESSLEAGLSSDPELVSLEDVRDMRLGTLVQTTGTVSAPPGLLAEQVLYLEGSGIRVVFESPLGVELKFGDEIELIGVLSSFHNELQIKVSGTESVVVLESGKEVEPIMVSTGEIGEATEGFLVQIVGAVTKNQGDTFFVDDGSGEARILIQESTGIEKPGIRKGDEVVVVGVVSQFNANHRILPRFQSDIQPAQVLGKKTLPRTGSNFWLVLAVFEGFGLIFLGYIALFKRKSLRLFAKKRIIEAKVKINHN